MYKTVAIVLFACVAVAYSHIIPYDAGSSYAGQSGAGVSYQAGSYEPVGYQHAGYQPAGYQHAGYQHAGYQPAGHQVVPYSAGGAGPYHTATIQAPVALLFATVPVGHQGGHSGSGHGSYVPQTISYTPNAHGHGSGVSYL